MMGWDVLESGVQDSRADVIAVTTLSVATSSTPSTDIT
jgi:hypothetical protein